MLDHRRIKIMFDVKVVAIKHESKWQKYIQRKIKKQIFSVEIWTTNYLFLFLSAIYVDI